MKTYIAIATAALAFSAAAQEYPTKPIHIIVPLTPGSGADIAGRIIAARMSEHWKQPVLVVLRADTLEEAIALVNRNPYANGTALFTESGGAARRFAAEIQVGMVGINVPIPVPVAYFSFGGWKNSLFGDLHVHGTESVKFYTRTKVVTSRWPHQDTPAPGFHMPTLG